MGAIEKSLNKSKISKKPESPAKKSPAPKGHYDWDVTEAELIDGLDEDLRDAWQKLRAFAAGLGAQSIYASAKSIMFSKKVSYFFVRPRKSYLEVCIFLPRKIEGLRSMNGPTRNVKHCNLFKLVHADQIEEPLTGGATAVYTSSPSMTPSYYRHSDWLGSSRFASTPSRTMYSDTAYAPFGEAYAGSGTADPSFTGMDQDTSSNVYDFPAREYGIQGRWPSPDPLGIGAVDPTDPQSWNRYAYVRNSPLSLIDPTGMDACIDRNSNVLEGLGEEGCAERVASCQGDLVPVCARWVGYLGDNCRYDFNAPTGMDCTPDCPASQQTCGPLPRPPNPGGTDPGTGGGAPQAPPPAKTCTALARVLQGNPATVGAKQGHGAFNNPPNPIAPQAGSAAMTPSEFGGLTTGQLKPYSQQISGYFPGRGVSFQGVTDVNGAGQTPLGFSSIRQYLEFLNPGDIIIELITGPDLGHDVSAVITVPAGVSCPTAPPFNADPVVPPPGSPIPAVRVR